MLKNTLFTPSAGTRSTADYFPFGVEMNGRTTNSGSYKYGYNGMELDKEVSGNGNSYTTEFRQYDPRLGRWKSLDPLMHQFPWMSPYVGFDNNPVYFVDPYGLSAGGPEGDDGFVNGGKVSEQKEITVSVNKPGPSSNPKNSGTNEKRAMNGIDLMTSEAGRKAASDNFFSRSSWSGKDLNIKGTLLKRTDGCKTEYETDTKADPKNEYNMYVSNNTTLYVDESQAERTNNYESFTIINLMQNFITGEGPENYVFPVNGIISSNFLGSDVLNNAIKDFNTGKSVNNIQYEFKELELAKDILRTGTMFGSVTGVAGSVSITITPSSTGIAVKIFNVTSLTSGDISKDVLNKSPSKSYVRDSNKVTPYGNISQTFYLFIPYGK